MENGDWKYTLNISFEQAPGMHQSGNTQGVKMYFTNLPDAFNMVIYLNPNAFLDGLSKHDDLKFLRTGQPVAGVSIASPGGSPVLEVKLEREGPENGMGPGIYYHFPKGIQNFEQELGQRLADFKGYDTQKPFLLSSYLVNEPGSRLKHSLAYSKRSGGVDRSHSIFMQSRVILNTYFFGKPGSPSRTVDPSPLQQFYFFKEPGAAIKHLLAVDYNKLDEDVAWENDRPSFYSLAEAYLWYSRIGELISVKDHERRIGDNIQVGPGVYLLLSKQDELARISMELFPFGKEKHYKTFYQVGNCRTDKVTFRKAAGLDKILRPLPTRIVANLKKKKLPKR